VFFPTRECRQYQFPLHEYLRTFHVLLL
jgi:hypothetical protein